MGCIHPLLAVDLGINSDTGKHVIKILPKRVDSSFSSLKSKYGDNLLELPCGKCIDCKASKAQEWSVRCYLESLSYEDNCFVTLTYDDDHLPDSLQKKDFQKFVKSLRNAGIKFRYFGCGEYGSNTKRPHYHLILFGYCPKKLDFICTTEKGYDIFSSKFLSSLWDKGFVSVGFVEPASICYVARYNTKKLNSSSNEFILMSKRPGLGFEWIYSHLDDLCCNLGLLYLGEFGVKGSSRYIMNLIRDYEPFTADLIKEKNIEAAKIRFKDTLLRFYKNSDEVYNDKLRLGLEEEKKVKRGL